MVQYVCASVAKQKAHNEVSVAVRKAIGSDKDLLVVLCRSEDPRTNVIQVRMSDREVTCLRELSKLLGASGSTLVRALILQEHAKRCG